MRENIDMSWYRARAMQELAYDVEVGHAPQLEKSDSIKSVELHDDYKIALGRFVELKRRSLKLTSIELADRTNVEVGEILSIESDYHHIPEARTLYQLSILFGVSHEKLMELSGLVISKDAPYAGDAVRYAALSKSIEALSEDEQTALDGLVTVLSEG